MYRCQSQSKNMPTAFKKKERRALVRKNTAKTSISKMLICEYQPKVVAREHDREHNGEARQDTEVSPNNISSQTEAQDRITE